MSLRDVKRAMEVMVWFYEHFQKFSCLMQDEEKENEDDGENEDENEFEEEKSSVKETLFTFEDERPTLKGVSRAFKEERRNLSDHSRRHYHFKEEVISNREREDRPTVSESKSFKSFPFVRRIERAIPKQETVSDSVSPQRFPYAEPTEIFDIGELSESLLAEENVSNFFQIAQTVVQFQVT